MNSSRTDRARQAYRRRDLPQTLGAHSAKEIEDAILHKEDHKTSFNLPEIILGGQDGLVNVLGVILGVAAATSDAQIVLVAGLAATFAESVSMAAVAYTSKIAEADYYQSEYEREKWEIEHIPDQEREEIRVLYKKFGFEGKLLDDIVKGITSKEDVWLDVMMSQELKLEPVNRKDALSRAVIVGVSALVGSFIPLLPFFFLPVSSAIPLSLVLSTVILFAVGYYKARETLGRRLIQQGLEMAVIGMISALIGFLIGSLFKVTV